MLTRFSSFSYFCTTKQASTYILLRHMNTISYLIIEDELKSRQTLCQKIDMCQLNGLFCVGLAADSDEALWCIEKNHPDIILADINLPGKNGFECIESIRRDNYDPEIIYTSAYIENDYLIRALKTSPVNYLIKPIDMDELVSSLEKAIARTQLKQNHVTSSGKIRLNGIKEILYLRPEQIAYCRADGHYSNVFLTSGKLELICQSIGSIEKNAPPNTLFRIDRSSLLNIHIVASIDLKKQTCLLTDREFNLSIDMSLIGLKRLMDRLEQK